VQDLQQPRCHAVPVGEDHSHPAGLDLRDLADADEPGEQLLDVLDAEEVGVARVATHGVALLIEARTV